jgi:uncharacterized protein YjbI with pentapeptide repeats
MSPTEKRFAGRNLRGKSFREQNLSEEDFSGADLRGADFTDAILRGANFSKAKTGVRKRWLVFQLIISFVMSAMSGILASFAGLWIATFFSSINIPRFTIFPAVAMIVVMAVMFFSIVRQGFTASAFATVVGIVAVAGIVAATAAVSVSGAVAGTVALAGAGAGAGTVAAGTVAVVGAVVAGSGVRTVKAKWSAHIREVVAGVSTILCLVAGTVGVLGAVGALDDGVAVAVASAIISLTIYVASQTLKGNPKFDTLLKFGAAVASIGGTSFRGADLQNADFTEADLKTSDFRNSPQKSTNLTRTIWMKVANIDRAMVGQSILSNLEVRKLLVTGKPNKSYEGLDLRGANLDGVYLKNVNFKGANLIEASFRNANLEGVNLTKAQVIGTDFTGAQMTGVCLELWSYDHTTKFDGVDCLFVFQREGCCERRPHDPDKVFTEGDFTKIYSEAFNILHLLIHNGINREAFSAAWQKLTEVYPDLSPDDIQGLKNMGQDTEVGVAVSENMDKGQFEHIFDSIYETKLKDIQVKYQAQLEAKDKMLEAKDEMILFQKQSIIDIKEILGLTKPPNIIFNPIFHAEAKAVAEQNPITIKAGRDISGNVINLGEITGNVTNAINQIPNKEDSGDIKTLLTQLQEAISSDESLKDEDKAYALSKVKELAKIAIHDKPEEKSTLASKAISILKPIIDNIPTISKIVETVRKVFGA